jgi:hypothetical protein
MHPTDDLCRSFLDLWHHFDPVSATLAGHAEHDGRWAPWDEAALREHAVALRAIAGATEDLDVEDLADEIDRTALLDHLRVQLFRLEHERPQVRNPALWVEHACLGLHGLLLRPGGDSAGSSALARLAGLPGFFSAARETLVEPPLILVEAALAQLDALSSLVEECGRRFAGAWLATGENAAETVAEAEAAVDRLRLALRGEIAPSADPASGAIGEDEMDRRLHHEHASRHSAAELWRHANSFAVDVEREVTAAAAAIDPGRPWRDVYESVRDEGIVAGDLLAAWDVEAERARAFAVESGLADEAAPPLGALEAPGFAEVLEPVAEYLPPGTTTAAALLSAPVRVEDEPAADWYRGEHDRFRLGWLAARLGPPGRHQLTARRAELDRMVRREIEASSTVLGWGLYAEACMVGLGYQPDPAAQLAQRVLLLRDAQLAVVDLGIHSKQLSPADAIAYLLARLPVDQRSATADVRRLTARPLLACAAMLGRRELLRLEADAGARWGGSFETARFFREVLACGGLPVPLIRWGLDLDA